jgi:metal-responsive CopG/Arc/MetJ family transcriptional regulator
MKTAVSLPDPLFRDADRAAKRLGISRSELYARALAEFLERELEVTLALDRVYSGDEGKVDHVLGALQRRATREEW